MSDLTSALTSSSLGHSKVNGGKRHRDPKKTHKKSYKKTGKKSGKSRRRKH
jgi:hypothetical protein